ncbi:MAG: ribonuclease HII [Bacteroidetes bacterium]|uniref:Ribonuclease HII n=1 Tax=Candidatus Merdivivens pullicola TaxID=2840872 RepID=A0A9D9IHA7_9BACT|nr:ribonuclease HII [Candidatus Merdivivens pullicola]
MKGHLDNFYKQGILEAGCDEAGRGCLAGPVYAAAVILPPGFMHPLLNDSKQMSRKNRDIVRKAIEAEAVSYGVCAIQPEEIDRINILNASIKAMHGALDMLGAAPELILVDGNRFKPYRDIPHVCMIKGDSRFASIAAASVLAKCYRDEYMERIADEYPRYGWNKNKGYPTKEHREAINMFGPTPYHRKSFNLYGENLLF